MKTLSPSILAMYLGCKVFVPETKKEGTLEGINWVREDDGSTLTVILDIHYSHAKDDWDVLNENDEITRVKPILRPLSDMTEEEAIQVYQIVDRRVHFDVVIEILDNSVELWSPTCKDRKLNVGFDGTVVYYQSDEHDNRSMVEERIQYPQLLTYLISRSFDLFNLIPDGLAIIKV